jgi:hypothetical protein
MSKITLKIVRNSRIVLRKVVLLFVVKKTIFLKQ